MATNSITNMLLTIFNNDILKENKGKKFDIVLMNPPYDRGLGDKFLIKTIEIANNIISIQPANFLIGNKKNTKLIEKPKQVYYEVNREKDASDAFFKVGAVIGGDTAIHYINCNKDPKFIEYMSDEEDQRKRINTMMKTEEEDTMK